MFGRRQPARQAPTVRRTPMRLAPLGRREHLASLFGGGWARVSAPEAQILAHCSRFRPIDEHAKTLEQLGGGDARQIAQLLDELHGAGLLCTPADVLGDRDAETAPCSDLATSLITAHRPETALRALDSLLSLRADDNSELLVVDDSDDAANIQRLRDGALQLSRNAGTRIRLVNRADKQAWAERLQRRLAGSVPAQLLSDALVNASGQVSRCGANRNLQQLALCGRPFVSVDDDTLPTFFSAPQRTDADARAHSRGDPLQVWHHPTRDAVWETSAGKAMPPDAIHAAALGTSVAAQLNAHDALDELDDLALHRLTGGRVRASMTGVAGDSGMGTPAYFLWNAGPSLDRMTADAAHYAATRVGRNVLRVATQTTVSRAPLFMGACTAYDNRTTLPPFVPVGRNADGVFGLSLLNSDATAWIAHLPLAIQHDPPDHRPRDIDAGLRTPNGLQSSNLLCAYMASQPGSTDGHIDDGLVSLGHALLSASQHAGQFEQVTLQLATRMLCTHVERLDTLLVQRAEQPDWWAEDIRALRTTAAKAATAPEQHLFGDWPGPTAQRIEQVRTVWRNFGALLIHWPQIRLAASEALADGDHPGALL